MEKKNILREESIDFAVAVSDICDKISGCSVYKNQLLKSSSSIGANIHEAKYAQSRADFIHKLEIALKEAAETEYWIELILESGYYHEKFLLDNCVELKRMLIASINTAKSSVENK